MARPGVIRNIGAQGVPKPPPYKQKEPAGKPSVRTIDAEGSPRTMYTSPRGNVSNVSQGNFDVKRAAKNRLGRTKG